MPNLYADPATEALHISILLPYEINNKNVKLYLNGTHKKVVLIHRHIFEDFIVDELISGPFKIHHTKI